MKKLILCLSLALTGIGLTGCETTGDPNQGGIFWSESKAQDRLRQREDPLDTLHSDTARVKRSNRAMESQLNQ